MSDWQVVVTPEAEDDLTRLDLQVLRRIEEKLRWFQKNFAHITPFPLGEPWKGLFKWRIGDWRVVYEVNAEDSLVIIHRVARRDKVYKTRR